jgi:hypothetical protein
MANEKTKGTLPVPTLKNTRAKEEGSLLTRMSKLMQEHPHTMYCRRGMVNIFFPKLGELTDRQEWSTAYWTFAVLFKVLLEDGKVAVHKVGATNYFHWVG